MKEAIKKYLQEGIEVRQKIAAEMPEEIAQFAVSMIESLRSGGKILFFGNGGSAADAQHLAAEIVGRFEVERGALPAIALTTDTSIITAVANDYAYDAVFERQVSALGKPGDIAFGISTSGNSANVNRALETAKRMGIKTLALSGKDGGSMAKIADMTLVIPSERTSYIQEGQKAVYHALCERIDDAFLR